MKSFVIAALVALCVTVVSADFHFIKPEADSKYKRGEYVSIKWDEDGKPKHISDRDEIKIYLANSSRVHRWTHAKNSHIKDIQHPEDCYEFKWKVPYNQPYERVFIVITDGTTSYQPKSDYFYIVE